MKKRCLTMLFVMLMLIGTLTVPAFAADETSGKCGDDIIWSYYAEKQLLSIFGSGRMYDYGEGLAPWAEWADEIGEVQISSGIYTIGHNVFSGCDNLYYVSYLGTLEQWMDISIESGNDQLGLCCIECTDFKPDANTHFGAFADELGSVFWLLDSQGNLTVYGTGTMELDTSCGPADDVKAPWADWRDDILTVTVREGITATTYKLCEFEERISPRVLRVFGHKYLLRVQLPGRSGAAHKPRVLYHGQRCLLQLHLSQDD